MYMHAMPCDGTLQQALIRKVIFMVQSRQEADVTDDLA